MLPVSGQFLWVVTAVSARISGWIKRREALEKGIDLRSLEFRRPPVERQARGTLSKTTRCEPPWIRQGAQMIKVLWWDFQQGSPDRKGNLSPRCDCLPPAMGGPVWLLLERLAILSLARAWRPDSQSALRRPAARGRRPRGPRFRRSRAPRWSPSGAAPPLPSSGADRTR